MAKIYERDRVSVIHDSHVLYIVISSFMPPEVLKSFSFYFFSEQRTSQEEVFGPLRPV